MRVVKIDGEPWFVAADVCRALEIGNPSQAISRLDDNERSLISNEGSRSLAIVNESGLYSLILGSRKAAAKRFKKWVTGTVLPAIRKDGAYIMGEEKVASGELEETQFILRAMQMLNAKAERLAGKQLLCGSRPTDRHDLSTLLQLIQVVRPLLHHRPALGHVLREVVGGTDRVALGVRQLALDDVILIAQLMK